MLRLEDGLLGISWILAFLFPRNTPKARGDRSKLLGKFVIEELRRRGISLASSRPDTDPEEALMAIFYRCGVPSLRWRYPVEADPLPSTGCRHTEGDESMDFDPDSLLGRAGHAAYRRRCRRCGSEKIWLGPAPRSVMRRAAG